MSSVTSVPALVDEVEDGNVKGTNFAHEIDANVVCLNPSQNPFLRWTARFGEGIISDVIRRRKFYHSDWSDGIHQNLASAVFFLYFACLLPSIAFGALNESTTDGFFSVEKTII